MPTNRTQLKLRSANQEQFHRSRTQSTYLRRQLMLGGRQARGKETVRESVGGKPSHSSSSANESTLSSTNETRSSVPSSTESLSLGTILATMPPMSPLEFEQIIANRQKGVRYVRTSAGTTSSALATRSQNENTIMSFEEFKEMRRLLKSDGSNETSCSKLEKTAVRRRFSLPSRQLRGGGTGQRT